MRIRTCTFAGLFLTVATHAYCAANELVSMESIQVQDIKVLLPKIRTADGQICVSYVANAQRTPNTNDLVQLQIEKICDKPHQVADGLGGVIEFPKKLVRLQTYRTDDGMAIQVPELKQD